MFDVDPSEAAVTPGTPQQCPPPAADAVAQLNTAEVRVHADDGADGVAQTGEGAEEGEGGQKVTPWEVEVRGLRQGVFFSSSSSSFVPCCVNLFFVVVVAVSGLFFSFSFFFVPRAWLVVVAGL